MFRRSAALALAGAALFLALAVAVPLAAADHAYSHRYVIYGRVVDANGDPVPQLTLNLRSDGFFSPEGACQTDPGSDIDTDAYGPTVYDPVTDAHGDFTFCFHTHKINRVEPGSGIIRIEDLPDFPPVTIEFNPYFRQSFVLVQLPTESERANADAVSGEYTVVGRLWRESSGRDQTVEYIKVHGDTVKQEPVNVTLLDPQGNVVARHETTSNDYGDFAVRVPTETRFTDGTVVVEAAGKRSEQPATRAGITAFQVEYPPESSGALKNALWIGGWVVVAGAVVGGGYYGIRRMTEARELASARQASTRKRAKK